MTQTNSAHAYHYVVVNEALAITSRFEVGVLFSAGDPNVPHTPPCLVELQVHRVHARVVRGHGVAHVHWDVVLLQEKTDTHTKVTQINTNMMAHIQLVDKGLCST